MLSLLREFIDFKPKGWYEKNGKFYAQTKSGRSYEITPDIVAQHTGPYETWKQMGYILPLALATGIGTKFGIQKIGDFKTPPLDPNYVFTPPFLGMVGGSYLGSQLGQKLYQTNLLNRIVRERNAKL